MEANTTNTKMRYRFLGNSGIQVSVLSWGNWINVSNDNKITTETVKLALESGINFFDTAEIYGFGVAEKSLGEALKELKVRRESIVVSTKMFKIGLGVNDSMLSRKHIIEGVNNSLKRLQLDYVDIVFCHRFDEKTPLEEVCRAMNQVIQQGKAFYWATSEWHASQIMEAFAICEKYNLIKPICDQCQYNLLERTKVEDEYSHIFDKHSYGTTVWSPLFSGVLTGKYMNDKPEVKGTRFEGDASNFHKNYYFDNKENIDNKLKQLVDIAKGFNCSLSQLALAWVIKSPNVSTCILGTSKVDQLKENLGALDVVEKIDLETEKKIEKILDNLNTRRMNWRDFTPKDSRRVELSNRNEWESISKGKK